MVRGKLPDAESFLLTFEQCWPAGFASLNFSAFSDLPLQVRNQKEQPACKSYSSSNL